MSSPKKSFSPHRLMRYLRAEARGRGASATARSLRPTNCRFSARPFIRLERVVAHEQDGPRPHRVQIVVDRRVGHDDGVARHPQPATRRAFGFCVGTRTNARVRVRASDGAKTRTTPAFGCVDSVGTSAAPDIQRPRNQPKRFRSAAALELQQPRDVVDDQIPLEGQPVHALRHAVGRRRRQEVLVELQPRERHAPLDRRVVEFEVPAGRVRRRRGRRRGSFRGGRFGAGGITRGRSGSRS